MKSHTYFDPQKLVTLNKFKSPVTKLTPRKTITGPCGSFRWAPRNEQLMITRGSKINTLRRTSKSRGTKQRGPHSQGAGRNSPSCCLSCNCGLFFCTTIFFPSSLSTARSCWTHSSTVLHPNATYLSKGLTSASATNKRRISKNSRQTPKYS